MEATTISATAAVVSSSAAFLVVAFAGRIERLKAKGQYRQKQRVELDALLGKYQGRLLEAAVDWDRRMGQLWDPHNRGLLKNKDYCQRDQYLFRSYVFRLTALCAIARKFEAEAFYLDGRVATREAFDFLRYSKAFLWAMTTADLHEDCFPAQSHFANDQFRPTLDTCYQPIPGVPLKTVRDEPVFDIARLDDLFEYESQRADGTSLHNHGRTEGDLTVPGGLHKIAAFIDGLEPDETRDESTGRLRVHRWDRLCVLHLLILGFIIEFGYRWQRPTDRYLSEVAEHFVATEILEKFARALRQSRLGLDVKPRIRTTVGSVTSERIRRTQAAARILKAVEDELHRRG